MLAQIILRYTYRNHLDDLREYAVSFVTIHNFANYLRWNPDKAMMIKYGPVDEEQIKNSRTSNLRMFIQYDGKEVEFKDAHHFAKFLKENPDVAKQFQFTPK